MYGYLRPEGRHGRTALQHQQCALCHAFKRGYRQRTRLLAGYDPSALLLLVEGLRETPSERARVRCPLPPFPTRCASDPDSEAARVVADIQLFLAGEKLFDDRVDRDGRLTGLTERLLRRDIEAATCALRERGLDVDSLRALLRDQARLEADPQADLDALTRPTREGLSRLTGFAARAGGCDLTASRAAADFGAALGALIYLVDALHDVRRDLDKDSFNPVVRALGGALTPRRLRFLLGLFEGRARELGRALDAMPLERHRDALRASTVESLERRGRAALEALPVPAASLRRAGVLT